MLTYKEMDEAIKIVEQHLLDCQINQDYSQANQVKQKMLQLKAIRDLIEKEDILTKNQQQIEQLELECRRQIDDIKDEFGENLERFYEQKSQTLQQLKQNQRKEYQQINQIHRNKPNAQYLNMQKILNYLNHQKEFKKAEQYQIQLKELDKINTKKSLAEHKISVEQQYRNLKQKHCYQEEILIKKFDDLEAKLRIEYQRRMVEVEQRKQNQLKQINQERSNKLNELEKKKTKSLKVQIQNQLQELEYFNK